MADPARIGKPWSAEELDAIVADYFEMLASELLGKSYVKSRYSEALMAKIGRTHRSVEFKHQNISAVLDELGMPWIAGYIPKRNYQAAIFPAVDRYLSRRPQLLEFVPVRAEAGNRPVFVAPPPMEMREKVPEGLTRLVRKFDPVERDYRNRALGKAGEAFVVDAERERLCDLDRRDLAGKVRWIADEEGDGAGYDVLSFDPSGEEKLIEVKTTNGSARTPFFLSRNERALSTERPRHRCLYRVHLFANDPQIFLLSPPLETSVNLTPEVWCVTFNAAPS